MLWYNLFIRPKTGSDFVYNYQRIRDLREDNDLLQKQICEIIGCKQQQYQLYESGKREIPVHQLIQLAEYYNVSLDYITGRTKEKNSLSNKGLSENETKLIKKYRSLSENGKGKILERMDIIIEQEQEEQAQRKEVV